MNRLLLMKTYKLDIAFVDIPLLANIKTSIHMESLTENPYSSKIILTIIAVVVKLALDAIMQAFFNVKPEDFENDNKEYAVIMLTHLSDLLLNIRKDLYSKKTNLKRSEMLEFMINDIKKHQNRISNYK
tara:strand:+ start:529 stop:915 length:387 start_codon:yes stop_codon:yes gene_type:complete